MDFQSFSRVSRVWQVGIGSAIAVGLGVGGWLSSDDYALRNLSRQNNLTSSDQIFGWVTRHYHQASTEPVQPSQSLQAMLSRSSRQLWCDEGAILLSLLHQQQGYRTRLVDLLGPDGISHHTTLQVWRDGRWTVLDFTSRRQNIPLQATVPYPATPRYRSYPDNPLQWILIRNGWARQLASAWRDKRQTR